MLVLNTLSLHVLALRVFRRTILYSNHVSFMIAKRLDVGSHALEVIAIKPWRSPECVTRMVKKSWMGDTRKQEKERQNWQLYTRYGMEPKTWTLVMFFVSMTDAPKVNIDYTSPPPKSLYTRTPPFPEPSKTGIAYLLRSQTPRPSRSSESV